MNPIAAVALLIFIFIVTMWTTVSALRSGKPGNKRPLGGDTLLVGCFVGVVATTLTAIVTQERLTVALDLLSRL